MLGESNVRDWLVELKRMADIFYKKLCSEREDYEAILEYDNSALDRAYAQYCKYREKLHYIHDDDDGELIDRHKVIAAWILAFTDRNNQPFKINNEALTNSLLNDFSARIMFSNEFYISAFIIETLSEFALATRKSSEYKLDENNYRIRFPDKIRRWELAADSRQEYEEHLIPLLATMTFNDDIDIKCLLIMSHLTYFYEMAYDCAVKGFNEAYYSEAIWWEIGRQDSRYQAAVLKDLYNRHALECIWKSRVSSQKQRGIQESASIIFIDGDEFKKVNDKYGHDVGDEVLKIYSNSILEAIDSMSDSVKHNTFPARWGGEEFVVCVYNCRQDEIIGLATEIAKATASIGRWNDLKLREQCAEEGFFPRTISQGIAYVDKCDDAVELLDIVTLADKQMYMAKNQGGRNCIYFRNERL